MTLKDKMNIVAQKNSLLKQAEVDMAAAVSSLATAAGPDDAVLHEGQAIHFPEDNSVFVLRDGDIVKHPLAPILP